MTFVDAAIEVLKREGKPLEVRRLAELAVRHNLLSVVGRDPVGTMQERLDDALEKPDARMPLFQVQKGVYGLRVYPPRPYPAAAPAPSVGEKPTNGHGEAAEGGAAQEKKEGAAAAGEAAGAGEKKRRRRGRRGGRGRRGRREGGEATATADEGVTGEEEEALEAEGAGASEAAEAEAVGAAGEAGAGGEAGGVEEKRSRRRSRRGGRGRRSADRDAAAALAAPEAEEEPGEEAVTGQHPVIRVGETEIESDEPLELVSGGVVVSDEEAAVTEEPSEEAAVIAAPSGESAMTEAPLGEAAPPSRGLMAEDAELLDEELGDEDFDLPGGPLLAPSHGAEEVTRSEDVRVVREEILGRRTDERGRRHGRDRGRGRREREGRREGRGHEARAHEGREGRAPEARAHEGSGAAATEAPRPSAGAAAPLERAGDKGNLIDVVLEILRGSDGRPMHVRAMADVALKRNLVSGGHGDVVRQLRAALVREQRDREADGLRARVRSLGGGHFAPADRKLDAELAPLERDLAHASQKLRDATRAAVRRRIQRLSPPAFEALCRALLDKLGVTGVELVRRGDGVAYWGGQRQAGVATVKTLVGMRPGDQELGRRAVGELRAGLSAKGFDEGLLLAAGRLNAEALGELKNGAGVSAHDAESLAAQCLKHGLGVRRVQMPIDYLDLELFSELTEA